MRFSQQLLVQTQAHEQEAQRLLELTQAHEQEAAQIPGRTESDEQETLHQTPAGQPMRQVWGPHRV